MLSDGIMNVGRIAVMFALAINFESQFGVDLGLETFTFFNDRAYECAIEWAYQRHPITSSPYYIGGMIKNIWSFINF
jgi:hypothetical protein